MTVFEKLKFSQRMIQSLNDAGVESFDKQQLKIAKRLFSGQHTVCTSNLGEKKQLAYIAAAVKKFPFAKDYVPRLILLLPDSEKVMKAYENFQAIASHTDLRIMAIAKGQDQEGNIEQLEEGIDVLIATPGLCWNYYMSNILKYNEVQSIIIDDLDFMTDLNYQGDIQMILEDMPQKAQVLFFMESNFEKAQNLIDRVLPFYEEYAVDEGYEFRELVPNKLYEAPNNRTKLNMIVKSIAAMDPSENLLLYTRSTSSAILMAQYMERNMVGAFGLVHSGRDENVCLKDITSFSEGNLQVVLTTQDFIDKFDTKQVQHWINFEIPHSLSTFIEQSAVENRAENATTINLATIEEHMFILKLEEDGPFTFEIEDLPDGVMYSNERLAVEAIAREKEKVAIHSKGKRAKEHRGKKFAGPQDTRKITKFKKKK
jgi:ATP-dependent RNA helicase RhlE